MNEEGQDQHINNIFNYLSPLYIADININKFSGLLKDFTANIFKRIAAIPEINKYCVKINEVSFNAMQEIDKHSTVFKRKKLIDANDNFIIP